MNFKRSNKAPLSDILANRLANQRAAKDLVGMSGVSGSFTYSQVSGATTMTHAETVTYELPTAVSVTPAVQNAGALEYQNLSFESKTPTAGSFTIDFGGGRVTAAINWDDDNLAVTAKIQATDPTLASVVALGTYATNLTVVFYGTSGPQTLMVIPAHTLVDGGGAITITPSLISAGVVETQTITANHVPTAGSWTLTYGAWTTGALAWDISAANLETAIRALDASLGTITVAGSFATQYTVSFVGVVPPVTLLVAPAHTLTYPVTTPVTINIAGSNNQTVTFSAVPDAGTWTLTYGLLGDTGPLAFNANAAAVQLAIRAIDPSLALMTVAGDYVAGFTCAFLGVAVTECIDVVGSGFTVVPDAVDGAFNVYFEKNPKEILFAKASAHTAKAVAANSDIYELDVSGFAADVSPAYVTFRFVEKAAPHTVTVPLTDMLVNFEIKCVYSDVDLI